MLTFIPTRRPTNGDATGAKTKHDHTRYLNNFMYLSPFLILQRFLLYSLASVERAATVHATKFGERFMGALSGEWGFWTMRNGSIDSQGRTFLHIAEIEPWQNVKGYYKTDITYLPSDLLTLVPVVHIDVRLFER